MENFIVSARKYRPQTFDTVIGQRSITNTLKNAIKNNQLAQAFLFCGPRGVGKTTCARILAKTINCENLNENFEPCDKCTSCVSFNQTTSFNIHELDAASNNSVDDIRNLVDQVRIPPQYGKYKVYIIDEVHMLSANAFNAFLKTLEEPPAYAKFILATTEKHKIIPTILSRCQVFDFKRITIDDIAKHLDFVAKKEGVDADYEALFIIAQKADGALRDALSVFDQLVSSSGKTLSYNNVIENLNILDYEYYFKTTDLIVNSNVPDLLLLIDEIIDNGFDGQHFLNGFASHLRNIMVCKDASTLKLLEVSDNVKAKYRDQAERCGQGFLFKSIDQLNTCDINYKSANNKRLHIEICLINLCENLSNGSDEKEILKKKPEIASSSSSSSSSASVSYTTAKQDSPRQTPKSVLSKSDMPSISKMTAYNIAAENHADVNEPKPDEIIADNKSFTQEDLEGAWSDYAESIENNSALLFTTLIKNKPLLKENCIVEFIVDNKVQIDIITENKMDFMQFLKKRLRNSEIKLELTVTEVEEKTYVTPDEKFNKMAEKNPELLNFKKNLDLEIDFI
jgi:DNA polymerase-3 subunit gamma/tau